MSSPAQPLPELLRVARVARQLDVTPKRVYQLIEAGRLQAFKLGPRQWRVPRSAVLEFLRDCARDEADGPDAP